MVLQLLPRLAYTGTYPVASQAGRTGGACHLILLHLTGYLAFQKNSFNEPDGYGRGTDSGCFSLDCKANFVTEESLTQLHWPICSE